MKGLEVCKSTGLRKLHLEAEFCTHLPKKAAQYRLSCGSGEGNKDAQYTAQVDTLLPTLIVPVVSRLHMPLQTIFFH